MQGSVARQGSVPSDPSVSSYVRKKRASEVPFKGLKIPYFDR